MTDVVASIVGESPRAPGDEPSVVRTEDGLAGRWWTRDRCSRGPAQDEASAHQRSVSTTTHWAVLRSQYSAVFRAPVTSSNEKGTVSKSSTWTETGSTACSSIEHPRADRRTQAHRRTNCSAPERGSEREGPDQGYAVICTRNPMASWRSLPGLRVSSQWATTKAQVGCSRHTHQSSSMVAGCPTTSSLASL
jgi:hypothetical protein